MDLTDEADVYHPHEKYRGPLTSCTFHLDLYYQMATGWHTYGDMRIEFPNALGTRDVYLIPSGEASPLLRHSKKLREDEALKKKKQRASSEFFEMYKGQHLTGKWFVVKARQCEMVIIFAFYSLLPAKTSWGAIKYYAMFPVLAYLFFKGDAIYYYAFFLGSLTWFLPKIKSTILLSVLFTVGMLLGSFQYRGIFNYFPDPYVFHKQTAYNVLGGWLILWAVYCGLFRKFFASAPLIFLGKISFSLYVVQFLILGSFSCFFYLQFHETYHRASVATVNLALSVVLLLVGASVFHHLVDRRGITFSKKLF